MTTILIPGGFKPIHGGHIHLIARYAKNIHVKNVKVLVGKYERDGISQAISLKIAENLLSFLPNVEVEPSEYPSPILSIYKFIESAHPGTYAMGGVKKDDDYKRVLNFVQSHSFGGKYYGIKPDGVNIVELSLDLDPLFYKNRTDEHDGKPISGTILRQDLADNNFENFKTNYPYHSITQIELIWNLIK